MNLLGGKISPLARLQELKSRPLGCRPSVWRVFPSFPPSRTQRPQTTCGNTTPTTNTAQSLQPATLSRPTAAPFSSLSPHHSERSICKKGIWWEEEEMHAHPYSPDRAAPVSSGVQDTLHFVSPLFSIPPLTCWDSVVLCFLFFK